MDEKTLSICTILLIVLSLSSATFTKLQGPNICTKIEEHTEVKHVNETQPMFSCENQVNCENSKIVYSMDQKTQIIQTRREIDECCPGYIRNAAEDRCVPVCISGCPNGECVAPDKCHCKPTYGGPNCTFSCQKGFYGDECDKVCTCRSNSSCDPFNGECVCDPGYIGHFCEKICDSGFFGEGCLEKCRCENGTCHHITGECTCHPGYTGIQCNKLCPKGTYGVNCQSKCTCINSEETCDRISGACVCNEGWLDNDCSTKCPEGTYGKNCSQTCNCQNGAPCHHASGTCLCDDGWTGSDCSQRCPNGTYGKNCNKICNCLNNALCDANNGTCECLEGWSGSDCSQRCPEDKYGRDCTESCNCHNGAICVATNGTCLCTPGWAGVACNKTCYDCDNGGVCKLGDNCVHQSPISLAIKKMNFFLKHPKTLVFGLGILLMLVFVSGSVFFYVYKYRRQVHQMQKTDKYVSGHNFLDNPLYLYGEGNERLLEEGSVPSTPTEENYANKISSSNTYPYKNNNNNDNPGMDVDQSNHIYAEIKDVEIHSNEYDCLEHMRPLNTITSNYKNLPKKKSSPAD